ncbi:alpha/beta hydrolase [Arenicella sp. 4NH20-0111]|uniref:alpha/beta fold hydrolase n=1 Tax=Arenicella sp. 4NH20-0111 TaxID=3127648 RepID=UPI0031041B31
MTDYVDIWYQGHDGLPLYARDYSLECGEGCPVILCMHGLTRNSADFDDISAVLAKDYRLIAVDQRGRGRSTYDHNSDNYAPSIYVQDMFVLLQKLDVTSVILMGTSMGGIMSMMMSSMKPTMFSALIINDIGPEIDPRGIERINSYVGKTSVVQNWDQATVQAKVINGDAFPNATQEDWTAFAKRIYREAENGEPVLAYDPAIAKPFTDNQSTEPADLWPVFDAMGDVPLLLIRGELSDIISTNCVAKMRERRPAMAYAQIPNVGHAPLLSEPCSISAIEQFLSSLN